MKDQITTFLYACLVIIFSFSLVQANTLTVTTTADSGPGSLRQAMTDANTLPNADSIIFNIPQTDAGFNAVNGVWTIQPETDLPVLKNDSTVIDASTQTLKQGNLNLFGPEIELCGNDSLERGFQINSSFNTVKGLVINRIKISGIHLKSASANYNIICGNYIGTDITGKSASSCYIAIMMNGGASHNIIGGSIETERNVISGNTAGISIRQSATDSNIVIGNYIGVDASGNSLLSNQEYGILIYEGSTGNRIGGNIPGERNIICGAAKTINIVTGSGISIDRSNGNLIIGNYIGVNKDADTALPNIKCGINLVNAANNIIGGLAPGEANVISGNERYGVLIMSPLAQHNVIMGNYIGTNSTLEQELGNKNGGIMLEQGAKHNIIGPQNIIVNNGSYAVFIAQDTTRYNTITQNIIANHYNMAIYYDADASSHIETPPPIIQQVTASYVSGITFPGWIVEIFSDTLDEASIYEGSVTADDAGNFTWYGTATGPYICATATDTSGGTSELSVPSATGVKDDNQALSPQGYALQQNYPNPFNPVTEIRYDLPESGQVILEIFDPLGRKTATLVNSFQKAGSHSITWNGLDAVGRPVTSGIYFFRLRAGDFTECRKMLLVR